MISTSSESTEIIYIEENETKMWWW